MKIKEPFNTISHALGALTSLVGFIVLECLAKGLGQVLVYFVYGFSLVFLYSVSAVYHALDLTDELQQRLQKLDRTAIAFLIAGTATPVAVLKLDAMYSGIFLGILWGIVAVLVLSHLSLPSFPRWVYVGIYLSMGWLGLILVHPLIRNLSYGGISWLVAGGVLYTLGTVIYVTDRPKLYPDYFEAHELWHVFTLLGSTAHYVLIVGYTT